MTMTNILCPSKVRRFMSEVAGVRRYHQNARRAVATALGGVLWVAVSNGWTCNPERMASVLAIIERQELPS